MEDAVAARGQAIDDGAVAHIALDDLEAAMTALLLEIAPVADNEVVEHAHGAVVRQQSVDKMAADEPGAARDEIGTTHVDAHP